MEAAVLQPMLESMAQRLIDNGAVWKLQFDTYEREVERYGGAEAIELAEEIFHRDSEAVVALLPLCAGDEGADLRWQLMLTGIDSLYTDFGLDLAARFRLAEHSRAVSRRRSSTTPCPTPSPTASAPSARRSCNFSTRRSPSSTADPPQSPPSPIACGFPSMRSFPASSTCS